MRLCVHDGNEKVLTKKLWIALGVAASLGLVGGCLDDSLLSVPDGVAAVERERTYFAQSPNDPLLDVPAGTVIDDLAGLGGCWGAYADPDLLDAGDMVRADAEFYNFDFKTMRMSYQVLQRGAGLFPFDIALEHVYRLEISAPDRITVRLLTIEMSSDLAITQEGQGLVVVEDAEPFDLQITLDGDAFKFGDSEGASSDFSAPHRANLVFKRFDCPE